MGDDASPSGVGATILGAAPSLRGAAEIVRNGHERFDGTGCPRGLEGADSPLASRILFACDAFEAMLSERAYRSVISEEAAPDQLRRGAGSQFDPDVVDAFCAEHRALGGGVPGIRSRPGRRRRRLRRRIGRPPR